MNDPEKIFEVCCPETSRLLSKDIFKISFTKVTIVRNVKLKRGHYGWETSFSSSGLISSDLVINNIIKR